MTTINYHRCLQTALTAEWQDIIPNRNVRVVTVSCTTNYFMNHRYAKVLVKKLFVRIVVGILATNKIVMILASIVRTVLTAFVVKFVPRNIIMHVHNWKRAMHAVLTPVIIVLIMVLGKIPSITAIILVLSELFFREFRM